VNNSAGNSKGFSVSLRQIFLVLALSIGLAGFAMPGFSQSPSPSDNGSPVSAKKSAPKRSGRIAPQSSAQPQGPKIWLRDTAKLAASFTGPKNPSTNGIANRSADDLAQSNAAGLMLASGQAQAISMMKGDFDQDGYEDLIVGYSTSMGGTLAFYRGNREAFAPQTDAAFQAIGRGDFPPPFLPQATAISVPVNPDFIATGNFAGNGFQDLVIAANGGRSIYLLPGDGAGNFGAPKELPISGNVTVLASGEFGQGGSKLFVGTSDPVNGFGVSVLGESGGALSVLKSYSVLGKVSDIQFGDFGDTRTDAAFLSGGQMQVIRASTMEMQSISLPVDAVAFALGSFMFDRNGGTQIALLSIDGSVQIAARSEFDPRTFSAQEFAAIRQARFHHQQPAQIPARSFAKNGWKIVESFPSMGSANSGGTPLFFRTRVSNNGADDLMWLNASSGQMVVLSHADSQPGAATFAPGKVSTLPYTGTPTHALPMRINVDGRPGILALHKDEIAPFAAMPIPDPTFFVNRFDDPVPTSPIANACNNISFADNSSSCSIREAVLKANGDTIMVPAGTITLTRPKVVSDFSGQNGALYLNNNVTIIGAGQATTTIQAGTLGQTTGTPNGVDMVMALNEDISPITNATASISNLTLQNGHNRGTLGNDGDGGCMEYDTGSSGNANLFLTNVTMNNCSTTQGDGGGLVIFNFTAPGNGLATISNSIFQHNSVINPAGSGGASGGGVWVSDPAGMLMTNSLVINNIATQIDSGLKGTAGGILIFSGGSGRQTTIHSSVISGNTAAGSGGGIWAAANIVIDQGTLISGNSGGNDGSADNVGGGGIYYNGSSPDVLALSKVTITGNSSAGNGGAIAAGNDSGGTTMTMVFSRLAGNTSTFNPATANVWNDDSTFTARDNWWGTNAPAPTILDVHNSPGPAGATAFTPFIVLTNTPASNTVIANGTTTLTASFLQDSVGTAIPVGNLDVLTGVAPSPPLTITFGNAVLGTISAVNGTGSNTTGTIQPNGTATATFTAGNVGGTAHADATVDNATVTATIIIPSPPVIIKAFGAASVPLNGTTSLMFTIQNNNSGTGLTGVGFGDTFPAGLAVATPNGLTGTCGAGTITATAGTNSVSLSGGTIPASSFCTFSVNVTGTTAGTKNNTTGNVTSTEGGTGGTASASVSVVVPPSIAKAFGATNIALNGTTSLTFTITNPGANSVAEIGVAFTDTFPLGIVVATPNGLVNTCAGTVTATAASGAVSLTGGTVAAGSSCTIAVNVRGNAPGQFVNTTGNVSSTNGGTGNTATANLSVASPPSIVKAFGAASIPLNGSTSLTLTITNPNATIALTGVAFTDTLPAGLIVATPSALTSTCGGTSTAVAGSGQVSLTAGTLAATASCAVSVNVTGTTAGVKNNSTQVSSTEGGTGNTGNASVTVVGPPVIIKAFGAASVPLNGTTSLAFTIQNNNATLALTGIGFVDTLPAGLVIATPNGLTGACAAGTITATAGTNSVTLTGATIAASGTCSFSVNVTGTTAGTKNNTTGNVTSTEGGTGGTASASVNVVSPPSIAKAFGSANIPLNGTTSLTFTITNPAANPVAETGVAFTDTFPVGIVVATPNGLTNTCGGTATAVAGAGSASLSGSTIAANSSCTVTVNVTGTASGQFVNTTGAVTSTNGGTGNTATANLSVAAPPTISKAFGAATIPLNGSTSLTLTITNPAANTSPLTGVAFTDNLPAGLVVSTPNSLTSTCGGVVTAISGSSVVSLAGATLAPNSSCVVSVNNTGTTGGIKNNSTQATSTEGGAGNTANASITVVSPPVIIKAFGAASVPLNGTTSLTFTIQNNNATSALTGIGFVDTLPAGLVVSTPNGLTGACAAGTITATAGANSVTLTGATIAASGTCSFSVNVTGTTAGTKNNTTGNVTSTEGGTGGTASASVNVVAPPSIAKAFGSANIPLNGTTSLTFTITNPAANPTAEAGVAFTDTFPAGIVVSTPSGLTSTCAGTATGVAGSGSVSLTGGAIAANANCTITVNVTGVASGQFVNTTGAVSSTNGGTGNTATASISVATPPAIVKTFGAATIPLNGSTSLTFTLTNPAGNSIALTGVGFADNLPAGLVVATPSGLTTTCGGVPTATPGATVLTLSGNTLAPNSSCTYSANVTGTTGGIKINSVVATATESGPGATSNATITVIAPPVIIKAFGAASVPVNGSTSLTFTIQNNNATSQLSGIAFTDAFPAGLVVSTPNGLTGSCGGGTITAVQATGTVSLSGATLAPAASCTFSVNTTTTTAGTKNNTTGNVTSVEGGTGGTASASLGVVAPPVIAKAFAPASISANTNSVLTLTITNPAANSVALTGVAFTDTFPAGLIVSTPNALANSCGGTVTATAGTGAASLTGGTVAANSSCAISVNVTSATRGTFNNTTGAVSSTNGGTGNTASASVSVIAPDLAITKSHTGNFILGEIGAAYTLTVTNLGLDATTGAVNVVDTLPAGLTATAISGTGWTCTLANLTCTRSDVLAAAGSYPPISVTVNVAANATSPVTNQAVVSGGGEVNLANDTASDVTAISTFTLTSPNATMTIHAGQTATFSLTVTPVGGAVTIPIALAGITTSPLTTIALSQTSVTPGSSPASITLTAATTAGLGLLSQNVPANSSPSKSTPLAAMLFPFGLMVLTGLGASKYKKNKKFTGWIALVLVISFFGMGVMGCVGTQNNFQHLGTSPGTYTVTVTASVAGTQQTLNLTLIVQP
jgi:uncharacterized repeat protein (TIGR01451 family)